MLYVKKLDPRATLPTVAHPGEDLGYDLYALENVFVIKGHVTLIHTGISCAAYNTFMEPFGLLIKERSSMALKGVFTRAGVVDAGYRGEIRVLMVTSNMTPYNIMAGDKIAQMIPTLVLTGEVKEVDELAESARGIKGFGSSGS
jgi:dUTP pyrophosphatase